MDLERVAGQEHRGLMGWFGNGTTLLWHAFEIRRWLLAVIDSNGKRRDAVWQLALRENAQASYLFTYMYNIVMEGDKFDA